jgi:hypothetical protein
MLIIAIQPIFAGGSPEFVGSMCCLASVILACTLGLGTLGYNLGRRHGAQVLVGTIKMRQLELLVDFILRHPFRYRHTFWWQLVYIVKRKRWL